MLRNETILSILLLLVLYGTVATADCLLKLYPNGIHVASEDDGLYPIHYAIGRSSSLDEGEPETAAEMVDTLLSRVPDSITGKSWPTSVTLGLSANKTVEPACWPQRHSATLRCLPRSNNR